MRIAIPVWRDRVSPVFDVAGDLVWFDVKDGAQVQRGDAEIREDDLRARVQKLTELGIEVLICGAISRPLEAMLTAAGVKVIAQVCGGVEEVFEAYQSRRLGDRAFAMPGCCGRRRGLGHGQRCRQGGRGGQGDVR